jgi:four helix bundle protein
LDVGSFSRIKNKMKMNYHEWTKSVPEEITGDSLWKMEAYRLALFPADLGWHDVTKLMQDKRTIGLADQLYRATGSISANISGGYSRNSGKDRARFYEYGLGSARECRGWFYKGRHVLGQNVAEHRIRLVTHVSVVSSCASNVRRIRFKAILHQTLSRHGMNFRRYYKTSHIRNHVSHITF